MSTRNTFGALLLLLMLLLVAACGKKGPVRPLLKPLPAAPQASLFQKGDRLLLSWRSPETNQDGSPLSDLARFRIYRMEYDPLDDCPECRDTSTLRREVDLEYLIDVVHRGDTFYFWDEAVEPGIGYRFRVTPVTARGLEGADAVVQRAVTWPPLPPTQLVAEGLDRLVRLSWSAPAGTALTEVTGYNVYRSEAEEPFIGSPVNPEPFAEERFEDFGLTNEQSYRYAVRSVAKGPGGIVVESDFSETVVAVPQAGR